MTNVSTVSRRKASLLGGLLLPLPFGRGVRASGIDLASARIEATGDWRGSLPESAATVMTRMKDACLAGVPLLSDQQPLAVRVENHTSGNPAVWLHPDGQRIAWILVNVGERDWCKLAYQFGHELGHVLANSWGAESRPSPPCQWLEESLVEAFSLRGLRLLAEDWARRPPFVDDQAFSQAIQKYQETMLARYAANALARGATKNSRAWFAERRAELERPTQPDSAPGGVIPAILWVLERDKSCVADIGALNRWPGRSSLELTAYLQAWSQSCRAIGAKGGMVTTVREMLIA